MRYFTFISDEFSIAGKTESNFQNQRILHSKNFGLYSMISIKNENGKKTTAYSFILHNISNITVFVHGFSGLLDFQWSSKLIWNWNWNRNKNNVYKQK